MKGIVLYVSTYGSTRQYAQWISEETGFPLIDLGKVKKPDLSGYDLVVIGGWINAMRLQNRGWIKNRWNELEGKNVLVFSTSVADPEKHREEFLKNSFPEEIRRKIEFFPLPGRWDLDDRNSLHRGMTRFASAIFRNDPLMTLPPDRAHELFEKMVRATKGHLKGYR